MLLGKKLKELRNEKEISQENLAKILKISRSALALYETDKRQIPNELLPKFAEFFDVSIDYLFGLED